MFSQKNEMVVKGMGWKCELKLGGHHFATCICPINMLHTLNIHSVMHQSCINYISREPGESILKLKLSFLSSHNGNCLPNPTKTLQYCPVNQESEPARGVAMAAVEELRAKNSALIFTMLGSPDLTYSSWSMDHWLSAFQHKANYKKALYN